MIFCACRRVTPCDADGGRGAEGMARIPASLSLDVSVLERLGDRLLFEDLRRRFGMVGITFRVLM